MKPGFIPALGTPLDNNGELVVESYKKEINDQIEAGAVAILCMGSMGQQPYLRQDVCPKVATAAVEAAAGRVPVFVGAMDCSIGRAKERLAAMEHLDVDGFVLTAPYYYASTKPQLVNYFKGVAAATKKPVLLYDLAVVTQSKITYELVLELIREIPNLKGIKSADTVMFRKLKLNPDVPKDFIMVYSGLDTFDIAYKWGIEHCLDGMMTCTPKNSKKLFDAMAANDYEGAAKYLDNIVSLRDCMVQNDIWPSYTAAMNLLGCEGSFAPDYMCKGTEAGKNNVREEMKRIGEI